MFANTKYSAGKALLVLGLCLAITLGGFMALIPATVHASGQAVEKAVDGGEKLIDGNSRPSDPDFDWAIAIYTLIIRFVGIFIVLGVIQVIMQVSGRIFMNIDAKKKAQAQASK
ncbi:hypothetical protein [Desulfatibacillum aliphaticivorans]|uniref:hypothetical protein n=1 Tax=Desulfatibacillum aliphaticivorans TaxID=218208 RepID=UPI00041CA85D|nr:hypothetical protein [Desulfatibacillum aliphaticivorans]